MSKYLHLTWSILLALWLAALFGLVLPAQGTPLASSQATITVDTLEDEDNGDGDCALREAIRAANDNIPVDACPSGDGVFADTITFAASGTITLTAQLDVSAGGPLLIDGGGSITVSGGNSARIFYVNTGAEITLSSLTISDGYENNGGGIYNEGTLTITNSILSDNSAGDWGRGGGIYNEGTLTIITSTLSDNSVGNYGDGGGIHNSGPLTIINSALLGNNAHFGGGIWNSNAMNLTNSTLAGNSAGNDGGAIDNRGPLTIISSTLSGNSAQRGGGIDNLDPLTITNSTLSNNSVGAYGRGGGIRNSGTLIIINSTLSDNSAAGYLGIGGGIDNDQYLIITNSTFSGNRSDLGGGAINSFGQVTLRNSIIAKSDYSNTCSGTITDGGYNIEYRDTCGFDPANGSMPNTDPLLGPLKDNGGPTLTHALFYGSPAIDAGDPLNCPSTDQRGVPRPIDGDGDGEAICDIGPFEAVSTFNLFLPIVSR